MAAGSATDMYNAQQARRVAELMAIARRVRRRILRLASVRMSHIGAALSVTDILVALYFGRLNYLPNDHHWPDRDRCILSKGHGALALYATLAEAGVLPMKQLDQFGTPNSPLAGHPVEAVPGVEAATGSLGHGLGIAAGITLAARLDNRNIHVVAILGDGELDEGSVWEAAMFAPHHGLGGLVAIVDRNGYQQEGLTSRILNLEPLADRWRAFGWRVIETDGHNYHTLSAALNDAWDSVEQPTVIIAHTVKGKGVSFMENEAKWHIGWLQGETLDCALKELEEPEAGR